LGPLGRRLHPAVGRQIVRPDVDLDGGCGGHSVTRQGIDPQATVPHSQPGPPAGIDWRDSRDRPHRLGLESEHGAQRDRRAVGPAGDPAERRQQAGHVVPALPGPLLGPDPEYVFDPAVGAIGIVRGEVEQAPRGPDVHPQLEEGIVEQPEDPIGAELALFAVPHRIGEAFQRAAARHREHHLGGGAQLAPRLRALSDDGSRRPAAAGALQDDPPHVDAEPQQGRYGRIDAVPGSPLGGDQVRHLHRAASGEIATEIRWPIMLRSAR
jgi:hypothetical protein